MDRYLSEIEQLFYQFGWISAIVTIVLGFIFCFYGYKIFKLLIYLAGFVAGAFIGSSIGYAIADGGDAGFWIGAVLGGLVVGWLAWLFYYVGIFIVGVLLGAGVVEFSFISHGNHAPIVALVIAGLLGGILAVIFQQFIITLYSSFTGSFAMVASVAFLVRPNIGPLEWLNVESILEKEGAFGIVVLLAWIMLGIFGIFSQYRRDAKKKKSKEYDIDGDDDKD